jgi:cyclopropane fatty-acyl-phospholipid synthase-like methyltransferase
MSDWWQSFFSGSWIDLQRVSFSEEETARQTRFVVDALGLVDGESVLDVPCGAGRIAIGLARHGTHVTGVDQGADLIESARETAAREGLALELHQRDMRDLPWSARFDAALCFWGSFGYLGDDGDRAFLHAVARALKPGGRFLLDTHVVESLLPAFQPKGWIRLGDTLVLESRAFDHERGTSEVEWTTVRDGVVEVKTSSIRIYTYRELAGMLRDAGFTDLTAYDGHEQKPFRTRSRRLDLVCIKGY